MVSAPMLEPAAGAVVDLTRTLPRGLGGARLEVGNPTRHLLAPRREPIAAPPGAPQAAIDMAKRRLGDLTRSGCLSLGRLEREEV